MNKIYGGALTTDAAIELLVRKVPGDRCLFCGGAPNIISVFKPEDPQAWGGIKGLSRIFRYCLCHKCLKIPGVDELAAAAIQKELRGEMQ